LVAARADLEPVVDEGHLPEAGTAVSRVGDTPARPSLVRRVLLQATTRTPRTRRRHLVPRDTGVTAADAHRHSSRSGEAPSLSPRITFSWGFQWTASRWLLDAACPCFNVVCKPNRTGSEAGDWLWEVGTVGVPGRRSAADANYLGHLGESREPELHAGTLDRRSEVVGIFMT
jgi:hypothetical protein